MFYFTCNHGIRDKGSQCGDDMRFFSQTLVYVAILDTKLMNVHRLCSGYPIRIVATTRSTADNAATAMTYDL